MPEGTLSLHLPSLPIDEWTRWHKRVVRARLISYMSYAKDEKKRSAALAIMSKDLQLQMKRRLDAGDKSQRLALLYDHEKTIFSEQKWEERLPSSLNIATYHRRFYHPRKMNGDDKNKKSKSSKNRITAIMTIGDLTLEYIAAGHTWDHDENRNKNTISLTSARNRTAKKQLRHGSWGFDGNDSIRIEHFPPYKPVAHLAAALNLMLMPDREFKFDRKCLTTWRQQMNTYLGYACAFQRFLPEKRKGKNWKSAFDNELILIEDIPGLDIPEIPIEKIRSYLSGTYLPKL